MEVCSERESTWAVSGWAFSAILGWGGRIQALYQKIYIYPKWSYMTLYALNVCSQHITLFNHCLNCTSLCICLKDSLNIHVSSKLQLFCCCLDLENNTVILCLAKNSNNNTIIIVSPSSLSLASLILNS